MTESSHINDMTHAQLVVMYTAVDMIDASLLDAYLEWASGDRRFYGSTSESLTEYWVQKITEFRVRKR